MGWEQLRPLQMAAMERYCLAFGCRKKPEIFCPSPEFPAFRYQHGPNPEHVLVIDVAKMLDSPASMASWVPDWLDRVHAAEGSGH